MTLKRLIWLALPLSGLLALSLLGLPNLTPQILAAPAVPATYDCSAQSEIPQTECEALVALYNATDGPNWSFQDGWLTTTTPCSWYGVDCFSEHVQQLNLSDNGLSGAVSAELGELSNLQDLRLNNNQLTAVPAELGQLSNLQYLYLSNNQLTAVPAELGQLSNLQDLRLNNNQLTAVPDELGELSNLRYLYLTSNQLTAVPAELGQLSNLWWLYLSDNQLTAVPAELGQLSSLQYLLLANNQLTAVPAELGQLSNLWWLHLSNNQLTAVPAELGQLSLGILYLHNNQLAAVPAELGQLSSLLWLDLGFNQLAAVPVELGQLSNLQELYLNSNQLTAVPAELGQLSNLQYLYLSNNQLTTVPAELGQLSSLGHLFLHNNQLTAVPAELGQLSSLQVLYLYNNPLSGPIPDDLTTLNLERFAFYNTDWCIPESPDTVQTWLNSIPNLAGTGRICNQLGGGISGQVTVTATTITLYRQTFGSYRGELVSAAQPDAQGNYSFGDLGQGINYFVHFVPPPGSGLAPQYYDVKGTLGTATPVTVTLGMTTPNINAAFAPPQPPLAVITTPNGSVTANPIDGTVAVAQANGHTADITVTRTVLCADQTMPTAVTLTLGNQSYPMSATGNPNEYSAAIPANEVASGMLKVVATCNGEEEPTTVGTVTLYDPSGYITDSVTNQPVVGASVTLYQVPNWLAKTGPQDNRPNTCQSNYSKAEGEPWNQPAPTGLGLLVNTDVTMVAPLTNRQTTDNNGYYGWDVPAGCWYVVVEAVGHETLTSPVVGVPTAVTDLNLTLTPSVTVANNYLYLPAIMR